ncbi:MULTISPECIES: TlyA family RNA methyltransferase [Commensalibacter]|uniref:Hemolysin A n=2 Tax=Commensalibacter TaxID=1079922 RepID=W7DTM2_9PROT|nr:MULTISPECIES: TlyA family RNA methyltransferase [Commensalibacter]EUK18295.1 hemolysin A [Commensalibacter papalotli (ex Servin-Garciduenas et al. 2014)]CAI3936151.1 Predicted rRNA methylase YqxC [Commensalibacter papalotli (ex Botero et al. 2024)]CAI3939531.1 Predicted rRNA methylase YqxC [Commensalibacter papalotli (ex Botero et al. 2024)]
MAAKKRIDILLVERGLVESRTKAQALIMAGLVFSKEQRVNKAGDMIREDVELNVKQQPHPWVSRGGVKLNHALSSFNLSPKGLNCLDIGASTGGFTDVLLTNEANKVYAIDVGHGQLAWKIRNDARVVVHEKCNARYLTTDIVPDPIQVVVCDASFISLKTVLPAPLSLCQSGGWAVALIKPQFEAGREHVGSKGVVRDPVIHEKVCQEIKIWWESLEDWEILGIETSPITGPEGNVEFLIAAKKL